MRIVEQFSDAEGGIIWFRKESGFVFQKLHVFVRIFLIKLRTKAKYFVKNQTDIVK